MQLPSIFSSFLQKVPLQTIGLTAGIFMLVFGSSATITTLILQSKLARLEAPRTEQVARKTFVAPTLEAQAAILYDIRTGQVLYEKNSEKQLPLASLTKLLTILTAAKSLQENEQVVLTRTALTQEGDSGFQIGEVFGFSDIAKLALVASSNDAAEAIGEAVASKEQLASAHSRGLLAGTISSLGLSQTYATNPTGLDESRSVSGAYGTAKDIAHVAESVLTTVPAIAEATTEPQISAVSTMGNLHTLANTNPTVSSLPGVLLSKTGYTDLAGGNLVMIFDIGINHPVAIVVLGSSREGRFTDVIHLRESLLATYL